MNYGARMLTSAEATSAVGAAAPLQDGMSNDSANAWMRMFTAGMTSGKNYLVLVSKYTKPKPMKPSELEAAARPSKEITQGQQIDCKVYERKGTKFTQVCWSDAMVFGMSLVNVPKKFTVMAQATLIDMPDIPTPDPSADSGDPGAAGEGVRAPRVRPAVSDALKDKAAQQAMSLRDAQYRKTMTGKA